MYIQTTKPLPVLIIRSILKSGVYTNHYNDIHRILICNTFIYNFYIQRYTCIYTGFLVYLCLVIKKHIKWKELKNLLTDLLISKLTFIEVYF